MAVEGKATIIGAMLKMGDREFRIASITELTNISRQLVHHHMNSFVLNGWVEKRNRGRYYVIDRNALLDSLIDASDNSGMRLPKNAKSFEFTDHIKLVKTIVYAKVLGLPYAVDMNVEMTRELDELLQGFKQLKRFLNQSQADSKKVAKRWFQNDTSPEKVWHAMVDLLGVEIPMSKDDWLEEVDGRLSE